LWRSLSRIGNGLSIAGATSVAIVGLIGLNFVHAVLRDWRRIPFTCSYVPGKAFIAQTLLVGSLAYIAFTWLGGWLVQRRAARTPIVGRPGATLAISNGLLRRFADRVQIWVNIVRTSAWAFVRPSQQ
jgi:hypothetical protein